MAPVPVIQIENLSKYYGSFAAVNKISFEVCQGEIFGFLGPNGAGKTTTIRMLLDLLRPSSGKIHLFGRDLSGNSTEIRRRCGYLPGNFNAYGNLTGMEFLRFCADLRNLPYYYDQNLLGRFELENHILDRKIKELSHGTMQKLGILQAFSHSPDLLILDEPTTGLDPLMQEEFYNLLNEHREKGCTIFLSSHNLAEVERICMRMAIIRKGVIEETDSIGNLRKKLKRRLLITLSHKVGELSLAGAELVHHDGLFYEFIIGDDINTVIRQISALPLASLSLPEPRLDEIFINFYRDRPND